MDFVKKDKMMGVGNERLENLALVSNYETPREFEGINSSGGDLTILLLAYGLYKTARKFRRA